MPANTKASNVSKLSRAARFEPLERRVVLSSQPCLFDVPEQGGAERAVEAVNCFGADLYSQLQQQEGNLVFSPLSVTTALAMTYAGAAGQTATEMEDVLHLGDEPGIHESFAALLTSLSDRTAAVDGFELELANAIWPDLGLSVRDEFVRTIETDYQGAVQGLDYSNPDLAKEIINAWVEDKTRGRVQDLLEELSTETRMVLTNSIYFKANWMTAFDPDLTGTMGTQFFLEGGEAVEATMMYSLMVLPEFTYLDGFQVLEMPLEGGRTSMVVVLPQDLEVTPNQLTPELFVKIDDWLESPRRPSFTDVILPRFTATVSMQLEQVLADMGMPTAFGLGAADFSNMTPEGVAIRQVRHKAYIDVNELGTEAAAATAVEVYICFAAGTPVLTPGGEAPIEQIKVGDYVLSKSESDVAGKVERKQVEAKFRGHAELFDLHVGGQTIRATKEHRFFAQGKGWTALGELRPGDLLATVERSWMPVERVSMSGEIAAVYNIRVADHHTYFVGGKAGSLGLWTHNDYYPTFRADHPFHFLIRDNLTSAILFVGRIDDPTQIEQEIEPMFVQCVAPSISGTIYQDANQDGTRDATEPTLAGWTVFVDANRNGTLDQGEQQTTTAADGSYTIRPTLFSGTVVVALPPNDDGSQGPSRAVTLAAGQMVTGVDIGSPTDARPASPLAEEIDATNGSDSIVLRRSGDDLQVFLDDPNTSSPAYTQPVADISSLRLRLLAGNDQVTIDYSGGDPLPPGGLHVILGSGQNTLRTTGQARGEIHVSDGSVHILGDPGSVDLFVEKGATAHLTARVHLASVHVTDDGSLIAAPGEPLSTGEVSIGPRASIRLRWGPLIMTPASYRHWYVQRLSQYLYSGQLRDEFRPNLIAILNESVDGTPLYGSFAGEAVHANSVLVAGTSNAIHGDYDRNGKVDQGDLDLVLLHWGADANTPLSGWRNDFPFDQVDQDDLDAVLLNWGKASEISPF